ncbi:MAG: response regulator [Pseudomonadota bacterium]
MRVLYLEDDPIDAEALRRALSRLRPDLDLTIAETPNQAREVLERAGAGMDFDVLVIDISLPEMNGFEFLDEVDRRGLRQGRRVVVFTSSGHRLDLQAASRTGVDDYVMKTADPVCFEELVRALEPASLDATARQTSEERVPPPPSFAQRLQVLRPKGR